MGLMVMKISSIRLVLMRKSWGPPWLWLYGSWINKTTRAISAIHH